MNNRGRFHSLLDDFYENYINIQKGMIRVEKDEDFIGNSQLDNESIGMGLNSAENTNLSDTSQTYFNNVNADSNNTLQSFYNNTNVNQSEYVNETSTISRDNVQIDKMKIDNGHNNLFGFDNSQNYVNSNVTQNGDEAVRQEANTNNIVAKPKRNTLKRVFSTIACGILFGIFAAVSIFAVNEAASVLGIGNFALSPYMTVESGPDLSNRVQTDTGEEVEVDKPNDNKTVLGTAHISTVVTDVTDVVDAVMPSIVSITNTLIYNSGFSSKEVDAKGSGIIVGSNDNEILIVTNFHVIDGNEKLKVTFCNEKEGTAEVKGTDSSMDLAVIAVNFEDIDEDTLNSIKYASIGNSDNLKVGEPAIAIGNALGYGQSVTTGVISATNRQIDMNGDGNLRPFIQTDAAINEGNSGGALLNIAGELIGINSNKMGGTTVEGMGYAIPISSAEPKIEELMVRETRKIVADDERGTLGISGATLNYQEILFYGYPEGVYVANVYKDSAAYNAGIREHDLISSFDGEKVTSMEQLQRILKYYKAGETVDVGVYKNTIRGYEEEIVTVTLGEP